MSSEDVRAELAEVLNPHWRTDCSDSNDIVHYVRWVRCRCGWESPKSRTLINVPDMHRVWNGHLAQIIAEYVASKQAEALREAADEIDNGDVTHEDLRCAGVSDLAPLGWSDRSVLDAYDSASVWTDWLRNRADRIAP